MSKLDFKLVATVRAATGAALHTCKRALEEAKGNVEAAVDVVRKMGQAVAAKKADRATSEGCIVGQVLKTTEGTLRGGLLECQAETDFVSSNESFVSFAKQLLEQGLTSGAKTLDDLLALSFANGETVEQARQALVGKVGENIRITRYSTLETRHHLDLYVHKGRYGCLVALQGPHAHIAKDIAVHIVVSHPSDLEELMQQEFYKDATQSIEQYLKQNASTDVKYIHCILGDAADATQSS